MIIIISALLGTMEGILLRDRGSTGKKILFGHFSLYHILLILVFLSLTWLTGEYYLLPYLILVQDVSSKLMPEMKWFEEGSWATWPTGKLYLKLPLYQWLIIFYTVFLLKDFI